MDRAIGAANIPQRGKAIVSVQMMAAPPSLETIEVPQRAHDDLDLDTIDRAIDRGDLDTVRRHLGLDRGSWYWLLLHL
jgi:hypothetical protein